MLSTSHWIKCTDTCHFNFNVVWIITVTCFWISVPILSSDHVCWLCCILLIINYIYTFPLISSVLIVIFHKLFDALHHLFSIFTVLPLFCTFTFIRLIYTALLGECPYNAFERTTPFPSGTFQFVTCNHPLISFDVWMAPAVDTVTSCGAHSASYTVDTKGFFPRGKAAGPWSWPLNSI
jgi:hypothetical protein